MIEIPSIYQFTP